MWALPPWWHQFHGCWGLWCAPSHLHHLEHREQSLLRGPWAILSPAGTGQVEISLGTSLEKGKLAVRPDTPCWKCDWGCVMAGGDAVPDRGTPGQGQIPWARRGRKLIEVFALERGKEFCLPSLGTGWFVILKLYFCSLFTHTIPSITQAVNLSAASRSALSKKLCSKKEPENAATEPQGRKAAAPVVMRMLFFWLLYLLCPHDGKQRKPIMSPHATVGLVGTAKPLQCCHGALIKYLLVGLAIYGPYVGAGVGVSLLIPVTETDEELKLYFTVWISKSFGVHWWNLCTKLFLDGSSDLSLTLWRNPGLLCAAALGLVPSGRGGWWPGRALAEAQLWQAPGNSLWSPGGCGSVFPAGTTGSQHLSEGGSSSGRAAGSSLGRNLAIQ